MKKQLLFATLMCLMLSVGSVKAETLDAGAIMEKMLSVVDGRSGVSHKINIIIKDKDVVVGQMMAGAAAKKIQDGNRLLIVLLEPKEVKGVSYLLHKFNASEIEQWSYFPYIGRVRQISGASVYDSFLGTDFNFSDLGYSHRNGVHKLLGEETLDGALTYKIETISQAKPVFYSRIVSWVAKDSFLPLRQDYYDAAGRLWKRQLYENITNINNFAVPLLIRMLDLQRNTSTEFNMSEINTDSTLVNDEMFTPEQLKYSLVCPVWEKVCYPVETDK
ncbi:MAG: outer membrane lipoprotein-sorting protein [Desulfobacterales bacterium]|jgi:hypothetical protein|nr:outer membrane lipoprotein-sorting protein [Desulfobacterales bacterium]